MSWSATTTTMTGSKLVYIVTGGNGGIGYETALALAKAGHTVVIGARNKEKLDSAVAAIRAASGHQNVEGHALDLGSLASVHAFAKQVVNTHSQVAGIVCNAGISPGSFRWTVDGVESCWGTNHLGHFYLVQLLRPYLSPTARIVLTSSGTHDPRIKAPLPPPNWEHPADIAFPKVALGGVPPPKFNGMQAYTNSKLSNIYMAYQLAQQLAKEGSSITAVAYDPGYIPGTSLARDRPRWQVAIMEWLIPIFMLLSGSPQRPSTAPKSGGYQARLAADEEFAGRSRAYFEIDKEAKSSELSYDEAKAAQLWEYSEQLLQELGAAKSL